MVLSLSWITTCIGPNQPFWLPMVFHNITHSPGEYWPRCGLVLANIALLRAALLSAAWKAFLALSRMARFSLNWIPWLVSESAQPCDGSWSSPHRDPGILVPFPKTKNFGREAASQTACIFGLSHMPKTSLQLTVWLYWMFEVYFA